ncbi:GNAT family N-acetyltransferase [Actinoplanes sp. N902-109]|uniref:GNAT family N-acetyltransferase n=1 Tax=Actinoplanes sp. (strain N902-109) TaxID=649831 RepID=UPI00032967E2|nr:N-acetyltransferase [Actinoplanes sp. N902-109]AGL17796.1 GCN5-related N-acetyltransferase [Actinoplanes sp. N902-109]
MQIRAEEPADHAAVLEVVRTAFGAQGPVVAELVDALCGADPEALSLVAVDGPVIAGQVLFSRSLLDAPQRLVPVQVLSPLAVLPSYQRQGVGQALIREGLAELERRRAPLVFLEGDPGYYRRTGFRPGGELGFRKPSLRIPDAAFQVVRLPAHEPWMTGTLVYAAPFWELDCVGLR